VVLTAEKASPAEAARAIVAGIIAGDEEIFPDKMSQGAGAAFFANPKGLERQVAGSRPLRKASQADDCDRAPELER
jgi:hypothetical protein